MPSSILHPPSSLVAAFPRCLLVAAVCLALAAALAASAQTLINVDFGVGSRSAKTGFAATGQATNDFWNLYRHYDPRFVPGMPLVAGGSLERLKTADGAETQVSLALANAPGVWGNASGDPMYDTYLFAPDGSNIVATLRGLEPGRYHFYFYGHADPDVTGEQNSVFTLRSATNRFGPLTTLGSAGWKAGLPWREGYQFVVFRDVPVAAGEPVIVEVAAGPNGVPVLNGLQIVSRGTSPPRLAPAAPAAPIATLTNLLFREVRYTGKVTDHEARFSVTLHVESLATNEVSGPLFEGDVAVIAPQLPEGLRIVNRARQYRLVATRPVAGQFTLELLARIARVEPWNQISFLGPPAAIASVSAEAAATGLEMQLLTGTALDADQKTASRVEGVLGADRTLTLRWQSKTAEIARKSLVTVDTTTHALITPTVIKYDTRFRYEILQAPVPQLTLELPAGHALTKLQGEQIRDWSVKTDGGRQLLTVEFLKPVEKSYTLNLHTEQTVPTTPATVALPPPLPLEVERESGSLTFAAEDMVVEMDALAGLRQVNAPAGALAAYRFYTRPFTAAVRLRRVEPVITAADRVTARLEETRLLVTHTLALQVEKAGIYALDLAPQPGLNVAGVRGEGLEDWQVTDGRLRVHFANRVLGPRQITVDLEQPLKTFPDRIALAPLRVAGAANETARIGAASALGIRLKTADPLEGLREIPVTALPSRADELLAFAADQGNWQLTLAAEHLPARVVAEVFNLITIGDGLVGGSATLRYGLVNQGVQEFRVKLPAHWRNVEFTGPNIRRKELAAPVAGGDTNHVVWTITLQDKAWGGYTLVITYDHPFDPKRGTLDFRGAHALGVERETGAVALTSAANLKLEPQPVADPLRVIDQAELSEIDRALISRPVLLAYRYAGGDFPLLVDVTRHDELPVLEAVADRTQLTSVLTEAGEMLTQAAFMVKNNDKQSQRFRLPRGANFWGCYVNNQPAKAERDGEWLLVSLPRGANRDEAFAVDIVYAQKFDPLKRRLLPRALEFAAPETDVPNTFAEWQIYFPRTQRLSGFGGTMSVLRGTTYDARDAWRRFTGHYANLWQEAGAALVVFGGAAIFVLTLIGAGIRQGRGGVVTVLVVSGILAVMAGMLLPALSKAKARSQRIMAVSSLKQIGLAANLFAQDNGGRFPNSFEEMSKELGSEKILTDPETGERFVYVGAGKSGTNAQAIIAYSPVDRNGRVVCFADGSVQQMSSEQFAEALYRDAVGANQPWAVAQTAGQTDAIREQQLRMGALPNGAASVPAPPAAGTPAAPSAQGLAEAAPAAAGLRSIRIELPRAGQPVTFTKVLNVIDEPLTVKLSAMSLSAFQVSRSALQLTAFAAGLWLIWRQWRRAQPSSLKLTIGLALALGAVTHLLIAMRALHAFLIAATPVLALAVLGWLAWKLWPRRPAAPIPPPTAGPAVAGAGVALVFLLLQAAPARGAENSQSPIANRQYLPGFVVRAATYTGTVRERVAQFDATIDVATFGTNQVVPLFGEDVAVQEFSTPAREVLLLREGNTVALRFAKPGEATLQFKLAVKLVGDVTKRQLGFGIPPALASRMTLTLEEPEADVEFPTAVALHRAPNARETRVEAILGAGDRVEMFWTPRVKRLDEMAASVFARNLALVTVGAGVVNTRATIAYQVAQGELRQAKLRLPAGERLLRVEGEWIRTWELHAEGDAQILTVDLLKGVAPDYRLTVETERLLDQLPATAQIELPHVMGVIRETGLLGLRGAEEITLSVESAQELQRVDAAEFLRERGQNADGLASAFRFLKPGFRLAARAEAVQPLVEAAARNAFRIGFEQVALAAQIDYTIRKAGVFALRLALPAGYRVDSVQGGSNVLQWVEQTDPRVLEVSLKERTLGNYTLHVNLARAHRELPRALELTGVQPLGVHKLAGFVSLAPEPGVALKTTAFDGLTEVPAAALGHANRNPGGGLLAYKLSTADPLAAPWKLAVATEAVESWVRAEVVNFISVGETLLSGRTLVRYDIQNAPVKQFRLSIPAGCTNVELSGTDIRRRDPGPEYRVELQNKVRGTYTLTVTWERPRPAGTNALVTLDGIAALGVERETGAVALLAQPPVQVAEKSVTDQLLRIDARELPDWAAATMSAPPGATGGEVPVLIYRYLRPGYQLAFEARRFAEAEVLQALVDSARLTSVVAEDGQMMTELALSIRNNGRQHLEVELPPNTRVWSAFVAGQPVRPAQRAGKLMLPLERSGAADTPVSVELIYVGRDRFPRVKGRVQFASPRLDVPLKNARWDLYLPPDYDYAGFGGTMAHGTEGGPVLQVYSTRDYLRQETEKKAARQSEARGFLSKARSQLASGKYKAANEDYNQARLNALADEATQKELEGLKRELDRAQGGNLIQAQRAYALDNARKLGGPGTPAQLPGVPQQEQAVQLLDYDAQVAERQWELLQKAQEVTVAKVQPLRVNLPTRGLRHSFSQVLQTAVNQPMTVEFSATNAKAPGWLGQALGLIAGFALLWLFAAVVLNRTARQAQA